MKRYALRTKHARLGGQLNVFFTGMSRGGLTTRWSLDSSEARTWATRGNIDAFKAKYPHVGGRVVRV